MSVKIKSYVREDITKIHPILEEFGFTINYVCLNGRFYETWRHEEKDITVNASYKIAKHNKWTFIMSFGDWDNLDVYIKDNEPELPVNVARTLSHSLKQALVHYLGGRYEVKSKVVHERIKYDAEPNGDTSKIRDLIKVLVTYGKN